MLLAIFGEIVSRLPCYLNASPLIFRTIRLYFGLGVGFDIKSIVNTKTRPRIKPHLQGQGLRGKNLSQRGAWDRMERMICRLRPILSHFPRNTCATCLINPKTEVDPALKRRATFGLSRWDNVTISTL